MALVRRLTDAERLAFADDGVVKIDAAVEPEWIEPLLRLADDELQSPSQWNTDSNRGATTNRLFTTRYLWRDSALMNSFVRESGIGGLVAQALGEDSVRFYFDHLLVKEPNTEAPTPWHQDIAYWPFMGHNIASAWVALTETTLEQSSLEFIAGSHKWNRYFQASTFTGETGWLSDAVGEPTPDFEQERDQHRIVSFDVQPGDALIFSAWTVHGSPANQGSTRRVALSTRWLGTDAVWQPDPGTDPTITQSDINVEVGAYPANDDRFPVIAANGPVAGPPHSS